MLENYITTVLSTVILSHLPYDTVTNAILSPALASICIVLIVMISKFIFGHNFDYILFWRKRNYVFIGDSHSMYNKLSSYFYDKYNKQIKKCKLEDDYGKNKSIIEQIKGQSLSDTFTYKNKKYTIRIEFGGTMNSTSDKSNKTGSREIIFSSVCYTHILEQYIKHILKICNTKASNEIHIYKIDIEEGKKKRWVTWELVSSITSKNRKNTIVADKVNEIFYKNITHFIDNESYFINKGLAYTMGCILHGPPGCGKTSIIKTVANEYNLPIFVLDLSVIKNNTELIKLCTGINKHISKKQKYLLVLEDIDRSKTFKNYHYRKKYGYSDKKDTITEDCILNMLDGVDENYGRITIMTCNKIKYLESVHALIRPGRIDIIVNIKKCNTEQIKKFIKFHFNYDDIKLVDGIIITPAELIQLIRAINDPVKIIEILNKQKDFTDIDIHNSDMNSSSDTQIMFELKISSNRSKSSSNKITRKKVNKSVYNETMIKNKLRTLDRYNTQLANLNIDGNYNKHSNIIKRKRIELNIAETNLKLQKLKDKAIEKYREIHVKKLIKNMKFKQYLENNLTGDQITKQILAPSKDLKKNISETFNKNVRETNTKCEEEITKCNDIKKTIIIKDDIIEQCLDKLGKLYKTDHEDKET
uniref:AAA family ATPase n=1 Tax=Mimivirus LCMiAC02 TaxID=2506609 RepID=A0A481Z3M4_9VIRU|nr:MAG: AAA family ATPase [Mimivirus LCMiAC02]